MVFKRLAPLQSHPLVKSGLARLLFLGLVFLLVGFFSVTYLPFVCFCYALLKTLLYPFLAKKTDNEHSELVNDWLVYCFSFIASSTLGYIFGGVLLFVLKAILTVFTLDLMFLRSDNQHKTYSVVLVNIIGRFTNKYSKMLPIASVANLVHKFETSYYPAFRLFVYTQGLKMLSEKIKEKPAETNDSDSDDGYVTVTGSNKHVKKVSDKLLEPVAEATHLTEEDAEADTDDDNDDLLKHSLHKGANSSTNSDNGVDKDDGNLLDDELDREADVEEQAKDENVTKKKKAHIVAEDEYHTVIKRRGKTGKKRRLRKHKSKDKMVASQVDGEDRE
jgi:hypothetical protein